MIEKVKDESGLSYTKVTKETSTVTPSASYSAAGAVTYTLTEEDIYKIYTQGGDATIKLHELLSNDRVLMKFGRDLYWPLELVF